MKAIETHGLFNMSDLQAILQVEVKVMKEMFEAPVDGEAYDMDRFGHYFPREWRQEQVIPSKGRNCSVAPVVGSALPPEPEVTAPVAEEASMTEASAPLGKAEDILSTIRARPTQNKDA